MTPRADVIAKVQELYDGGTRPVPYGTFIRVFNELLKDERQVIPWEPTDALREYFRAACMAVSLGVSDTQGRGEQRVAEFRQKVLPVWKKELSPQDFAAYEKLLEGKKEQDRGAAERELARQAADARSRQLLARLGLAEAAEEPPAPVLTEDVELPRRVAQRFADVDELCQAIRSGKLKVRYTPREERVNLAYYKLDAHEVNVKLASAAGENYVVLTADVGRTAAPDAEAKVDDFAAEMRYTRMAPYAYMRKDNEFVYTLKVGPSVTNVACATAEPGGGAEVVRRIQKLHWDLGELVERMRR